jgi:integrase
MRRRELLGLLGAALVAAGTAQAQSFGDRIVAELRRLGYSQIDVTRTLLGRGRIVARKGPEVREIIFNPRTGEILRDYWQIAAGTDGSGASAGPGLLDHDDDDGDDDGDGDDPDDDRGGQGGGDDDRDGDSGGSGGGDD